MTTSGIRVEGDDRVIPLAWHSADMELGETALVVGTRSGTRHGALIVQ